MQEVWRPVAGWETRYEVSSMGRVKSLPYEAPNPNSNGTHIKNGRILKPYVQKNGYEFVGLRDQGTAATVTVHSLVAKAFLGPCPGRVGREAGCWQVDHRDCNKLNNAADNLRWLTRDENRRLGGSSLSEDDVKAIRLRRTQGERGRDLAREYGITESAVCQMCKRKTWAWVED
jgi:hypothetical protein